MAVQTRPRVDPASTARAATGWWLPKLAVPAPWLITAVLAAVILLARPVGGDLAAQEYHAWVFSAHGALLWNNYWYGGHTVAATACSSRRWPRSSGTRRSARWRRSPRRAAMAELLGGPSAPRWPDGWPLCGSPSAS